MSYRKRPTEPFTMNLVPLAEALSWAAFGHPFNEKTLRRIVRMFGQRPSKILDDLTMAATKISMMAGDGKIPARGRHHQIFAAVPDSNPIDSRTVNISANDMRDFRQFDLELMGIRKQPPGGSAIIWREHSEMYDREFRSLVSVDSDPPDLMSLGFRDVEFDSAGLFAAFAMKSTAPALGETVRRVGRPRKLDHQKIVDRAAELIALDPKISKGSTAASITAEIPPNPKTGKPRDSRHIERIISPLWSAEGGDK